MMGAKLDTFTRAYIEAALWSSTAYDSPEHKAAQEAGGDGGFDSSFSDLGYDTLSPDLLAHVIADCRAFQAAAVWQYVLDAGVQPRGRYSADEMGGHDFWLTRNGHGAGFWDGDWPKELGDRLTKECKRYPEEAWFMNEDGEIDWM